MICTWLRNITKGNPENTADMPRPSAEALEPSVFSPEDLKIVRKDVPKMASRGKCPNGLEGLIIHFNAGRWQTEQHAIRTIESGVKNGYTYSSLSRSGTLYLSPNLNFDDWGYHAGESKCPLTGRTGVSRYYHGVEVSNPGQLTLDKANNILIPWYNRKYTVDSFGTKTYIKPYTIGSWNDEYFKLDDPRIVKVESKENIQAGYYLHYSEEQKLAIIKLCFYLKENFKTFSFDKVFGHDSVAPGRKNDPGGCLGLPGEVKAVSIPKFQLFLRTAWLRK